MCKHDDGCNAPEGECSGACMKQDETLDQLCERYPAVRALWKESKLLRAYQIAKGELISEHLEKIRSLESQLAELRQGGEAVGWRPKINFQTDFTAGEPSKATVEYWREQGVDIEYAYLRPQPAIQPGYAVPDAMTFLRDNDMAASDDWMQGWNDCRAMLAAPADSKEGEK